MRLTLHQPETIATPRYMPRPQATGGTREIFGNAWTTLALPHSTPPEIFPRRVALSQGGDGFGQSPPLRSGHCTRNQPPAARDRPTRASPQLMQAL
jgi:hypothetical protein